MASSRASPSLMGLPTEILHPILRLVLSPREIKVFRKSDESIGNVENVENVENVDSIQSVENGDSIESVGSAENNVVTVLPKFPLSPFLVCKIFNTTSHTVLDRGLVISLDATFATLNLDSILPEVIRDRVKYLKVSWEEGYEDSLADEKAEPSFAEQMLLSFPNLEAVLLDGIEDRCCVVEEANDQQGLETRLRENCDQYVRPYLKERAGIHLEDIDDFERAIKVHVHVPTRNHNLTEGPDYHFILATYKSKAKSWAVKDLCHDKLSVSFEDDGRVAICCKRRLAPIVDVSSYTCRDKNCVGKEWI